MLQESRGIWGILRGFAPHLRMRTRRFRVSEALTDRIWGGAPQGAAGFLRAYFPNRSNFGKLRVIRVPASAR